MKYLVSQLQRFIIAILFLIGGYFFALKALFDGIAEGDFTRSILSALLTGILIPCTVLIIQFYFRKSSSADKPEEK